MGSVTHVLNVGWDFYYSGSKPPVIPNCGKWMYFFEPADSDFADKIVQEAVATGVCVEAKHTNAFMLFARGSGVCCFYCNGADVTAMKSIISFFLEHNMIKHTKAGKLYDISFKFDDQTRSGEYGSSFSAKTKLSDFVDLSTGQFVV